MSVRDDAPDRPAAGAPSGFARWPGDTANIERRVLVIARNHTALNWVNELLPDLIADSRIQCVFTIPETEPSLWRHGVAAALEDLDAITVPWAHALVERFDLAIAATHRGDLERLRAPLLLLPHGPGFTRASVFRDDGSLPVPSARYARRDRVPATTVVVSHADQVRQLPPTDGVHVVVAGDPCLDALTASATRRPHYRAALHVREDQRLVLVSSTWGPESLFVQRPSLTRELLATLPIDDYQLALVLHPNIWAAHGRWQLRAWLRAELRSGLRLLSPARAWRSGVIAADIVVGDHGSVALYAAALRRPVLLAAFGESEIRPDTPVSELGRLANRVRDDQPLQAQVERALAQADRHSGSLLRRLTFDLEGHAHDAHRKLVYELLQLDAPEMSIPPAAVPAPEFEYERPRACLVSATQARSLSEHPVVALVRVPASLGPSRVDTAGDVHIAAETDCELGRLLQSAAVVVSSDQQRAVAATAQLLKTFPGARVTAALEDASVGVIRCRNGDCWIVRPDGDHISCDIGAAASAIYGLYIQERLRSLSRLTVVTGKSRQVLSLSAQRI